jgi:predicted HAD superfamily Cof-like phosphohydrolase
MNRVFGPALDLVREFHRDKGLPIGVDLTPATPLAQLHAIGGRVVEEAGELRAALQAGDLAEVIRELADVVYSALGVVVALDLSLDDAYAELQTNPVPPVAPDAGPLAGPIAAATHQELSQARLADRIKRQSHALWQELEWRKARRTERTLARLLIDCIALAVDIGVPLNDAFLDIHRSNMTKQKAHDRSGVIQKPGKGPDFEKADLSRLLPDTREQEE